MSDVPCGKAFVIGMMVTLIAAWDLSCAVSGEGGSGSGGGGGAGRGGAAGGGRGGGGGNPPAGAGGTGPAGAGGFAGAASGGRGGASGGGPGGAGGAASGGTGGGGACARELSRNGDFELAMMSWNEAPQGTQLVRRSDDPAVQTHQITPQSGLYVLRLGAPSTNAYVVHYVEQHVDLPANAEELTISGYIQVRSEEPVDNVYDVAYVQLFDEEQPPAATPFYRSTNWTNLTQANTWTRFSLPVNVKSIAGTQRTFRILADLDTDTPTYFYFDTISVAVTRCSP